MPKLGRTSTTGKTLKAAVLLVLIVAAAWACRLDTTPRILPHPPVESADDADSGDDDK